MTVSTNGRKAVPRPRTAPVNGYRLLSGSVAGQTRQWRADAPTAPAGEPPAGAPSRRQLTRWQWVRLVLVVVVLTVVGAAAGYGASLLQPATYAAHAQVFYHLTREQPTGFLREDRNMSTQLVLLTSRSVLQPVADRSQRPVDQLAAAVSASVTSESEIIDITFTDHDPARARQLLDAIVQRYLTVSNNEERDNVRDYLNGQLTDVLTTIDQVKAAGGTRQNEMGPLVDREQWLREQLDQAHLTDLAGPGAEQLVPAYTDRNRVSPRPVVDTAAGAATALVLGLLAAAVLARRATRP